MTSKKSSSLFRFSPIFLGILAFSAGAAPIIDPAAPIMPQPQAGQTSSGVPYIHINAPNAGGISHNPLEQLNVDPVGLIFNNSPGGGGALLGGQLPGNPNLSNGAARAIVAEVLGRLPSHLNGTLEIFGAPAWLIIANPNGISCDGCGIVNTPRFTLATGQPEWLDANGQPSAFEHARQPNFDLTEGAIQIARGGLEGTRGQIDLISQKIHIDGPVRAGDLLQIRNGNTPPDNRPTPSDTLTVDATAFGAMHAGRIDIAISGNGAGVRSAADMAARKQDMRILADGRIELSNLYAPEQLAIQSNKSSVQVGNANTAGNFIINAAGDIVSSGQLEAGEHFAASSENGDINLSDRVTAQKNLLLQGNNVSSSTRLAAGEALSINARTASVSLSGEVVSGGNASINAKNSIGIDANTTVAGSVSLSSNSSVSLSGATNTSQLSIDSGQVNLNGALSGNVSVQATDLSLGQAGQSTSVAGDINLNVTRTLNVSNNLNVSGNASFSAGQIGFGGSVGTGGDLSIASGGDIKLNNAVSAGGGIRLQSGGSVTATDKISGKNLGIVAQQAQFSEDLTIGGNLDIAVNTLQLGGTTLVGGNATFVLREEGFAPLNTLLVDGSLSVDAAKGIELGMGGVGKNAQLVARDGNIKLNDDFTAGGHLSANAAGDIDLKTLSTGGGTELLASGTITTGNIVSGGHLSAHAEEAVHLGTLDTWGNANLSTGEGHALQHGAAAIQGDLLAQSQGDYQIKGSAHIGGNATLEAKGDMTLTDWLIAQGDYRASTEGNSHIGGDALILGNTDIRSAGQSHYGGKLETLGNLELNASDIQIATDLRTAGNAHVLAESGNIHVGGIFTSEGDARLNAQNTTIGSDVTVLGHANLDTQQKLLLGGNTYFANDFALEATTLNTTGRLHVTGALTLDTEHLALNTAGDSGTSATGNIHITTGSDLSLNDAQHLIAGGDLQLEAGALNNEGLVGGAGDLTLKLAGDLDNTGKTASITGNKIELEVEGDLSNQLGLIGAQDDLSLALTGKLTNTGGTLAGKQVQLELDGKFANHNIDNGMDDPDIGRIQAETLNIKAEGLYNEGELLALKQGLTLDLKEGGLTNAEGGRIGGKDGIHISTTGTIEQLDSDAYLLTDGHLQIEAGSFINQGTIGGLTQDKGAEQITLNADNIHHSGNLLARGHVILNASDLLNIAPGSHLGSYGDLTLNAPEAVIAPSLYNIQVVGQLALNVKSVVVAQDQTWNNGAAAVKIGGPVYAYGTIDLSGIASGDFFALPTIGAQQGDLYNTGADCPAGISGCQISSQIITQRGQISIGNTGAEGEGGDAYLYNLSSDGKGGFNTYEPDIAKLAVTWSGLDGNGDSVSDIFTYVTDTRGPILQNASGVIHLVTPNVGIIQGENFTLTGINIINAAPDDVAAAQALAHKLAQEMNLGKQITPQDIDPQNPQPWDGTGLGGQLHLIALPHRVQPPVTVNPKDYAIRFPDIYDNSIHNPLPASDTRPTTGWQTPYTPGSIIGNNVTIDSRTSVVNYGNILLAGDSRIQAATGVENINGTINSTGSLVIGSGANITNRDGSINANKLGLIADNSIVNVGGKISGTQSLILGAAGHLNHLTEKGGKRAEISAGTDTTVGDILMNIGGDATLHNADLLASGNIESDINGHLTVSAQRNDTLIDRGKAGGERHTTWETSRLEAGNDLKLTSGGNAMLEAATLKAGGELNLAARDIALYAVAEQHNTLDINKRQGSQLSNSETTHHSTTLEAGSNITLTANDTLTAEGGRWNAGKDISVLAGGEVHIKALADQHTTTQSTRHTGGLISNQNVLGFATTQHNTLTQQENVQGLQATASNNLQLRGMDNITLNGVTLSAGEALSIGAGKNLTITAATQQHTNNNQTDNTYGQHRDKPDTLTHSTTQTTLLQSRLNAGGALLLQSEGDMELTAIQSHAGNTLLQAGGTLALNGAQQGHTTLTTDTRTDTNNPQRRIVHQTGDMNTQFTGSHITADNLLIRSGADAQLTGATLNASSNTQLDIGGTLTLDAGINRTSTLNTYRYTDAQGRTQRGSELDTLYGPTTQNARTDRLQHQGTQIHSADQLAIQTGKDLHIEAATLKSGNDLTLQAGGNLTITSLLDTNQKNAGGLRPDKQQTHTLAQANLNAGGTLQLNAVEDTTLTAVQLTGQNLNIHTGGDLNLNALELTQHTQKGRTTTQHNTQAINEFSARDDITLHAGRDLTATGGHITSEAGHITLNAGRDLTLNAATDTTQRITRTNSGGLFSGTTTTTQTERNVLGLTLHSGAQSGITLTSGNTTTLESATLKAGDGGIQIHAKGKITLDVAEEGHSTQRQSDSNKIVWESTRDKGKSLSYGVNNTIETSGGITLQAGQGIQITYAQQAGESAEQAKERYLQDNPWINTLDPDAIEMQAHAATQKSWDHKQAGFTPIGNVLVGIAAGYYVGAGIGGQLANGASAGTTFANGGIGNAMISAGTAATAGNLVIQVGAGQSIDWGQAMRIGLAGALGAGVGTHFGNNYGLSRIAAETATGCASSAISGGDCQSGAVTGFVMTGLAWGSHEIRKQMLENSKPFPGVYEQGKEDQVYNNTSGPAPEGEVKLGGARINLDKICGAGRENCATQADGRVMYIPKKGMPTLADVIEAENNSTLGAFQGGQGSFMGIPYEPGSVPDKIVEAFAGPHDWANGIFWGGYDNVNDPANGRYIGNAAPIKEGSARDYFQNIISYVDVIPVAPLGISYGIYKDNLQWVVYTKPWERNKDDK